MPWQDRYPEGEFAPLHEEYTLRRRRRCGDDPDDLDGRYLRNGPNPIAEIDSAFCRWFIGDGMVHGVRIRDGKAHEYGNRFMARTQRGQGARRNSPPAGQYGVLPIGANTNVIGHAGKTIALIEGGLPNYELTDELDTVGVCDFGGTLTGGYTAHPKRDPETGELHAVSYSATRGNTVQYSVIDVRGPGAARRGHRSRRQPDDARLLIDREARRPLRPSGHVRRPTGGGDDCATRAVPAREAHAVGLDRAGPHPGSHRRATSSEGFGPPAPLSWNPKHPARVGVMPREGGNADVRWFDVEPCYVFHPMNAYDEGDTIVLDVVRRPKMFDDEHLGPNEGPPTLDRWTVDLADGKVRESRFDDRGQEFPRVDERLVGKRHRYGYAVAIDEAPGAQEPVPTRLRRLTPKCGRSVPKELGEFVFYPSSDGAAEDDGVLMGYVYDRVNRSRELAILDAQTLEDIASIKLPIEYPLDSRQLGSECRLTERGRPRARPIHQDGDAFRGLDDDENPGRRTTPGLLAEPRPINAPALKLRLQLCLQIRRPRHHRISVGKGRRFSCVRTTGGPSVVRAAHRCRATSC